MTRRQDPAATRTPVAAMEAQGHTPPAFEPVPRRYRRDGWTPERQRALIAALAETGNVTHACAIVGMTPEGAYYLRRQPGAESFRAAWEAALAMEGPERFVLPMTLRGFMHALAAEQQRREAREELSGADL